MENIHDIGPDAVTPAICFPGYLFSGVYHPFCLSKVDNNIAPVNPLDNAVDNFTFSIDKTGIYRITLGIFHFLYDDLLSGLCGNTAKRTGVYFGAQAVTDLAIRI